ncbi:hypothetical protein J6590_071613 [Homalodisca vitripennis]|nr:hypothetical protein J6590_071613 [Homalodisca vitripennis]
MFSQKTVLLSINNPSHSPTLLRRPRIEPLRKRLAWSTSERHRGEYRYALPSIQNGYRPPAPESGPSRQPQRRRRWLQEDRPPLLDSTPPNGYPAKDGRWLRRRRIFGSSYNEIGSRLIKKAVR